MKKLLLVPLLLSSLNLSSHKFYTSVTQIEHNESTNSLEVIMNVFWDDLEQALSAYYQSPVQLNENQNTEKIPQYLKQVFYIKNEKGKILEPAFIGVEFNKTMLSIYLECPLPQGIKPGYILQKTLTESFEDQVNIVNFVYAGRKKSFIFKKGSPEQAVNLKN